MTSVALGSVAALNVAAPMVTLREPCTAWRAVAILWGPRHNGGQWSHWENQQKLKQLEPLRFKNTPCCPMITHTIDSFQIPSQNKTKSKLQIWKICQTFKFWNFAIKFLHATHFLKLLNKMCKYEMDLASAVEVTERTRFCLQTDGWRETSIPPFNFVELGDRIIDCDYFERTSI